MSKTVKSPIEVLPGSITISQPVLYPQYVKYRRLMGESDQAHEDGDNVAQEYKAWAAVCACLDAFDVPGFENRDPEQFPASPRRAVVDLLLWALSEVNKVITGEETVPND